MGKKKYGFGWIFGRTKGVRPLLAVYSLLVLCIPVIQILFATAALFFLNWKIAVILLVLTPLLMALMSALTPFVRKASAIDKGNEEVNRSLMQEALSRIMLVKTCFMQEKIIEKLKSAYRQKLKSAMKLGLWEGLNRFSGLLIGNMMSLVTLGLGAFFVLTGETTVGSLIMIVQLLNYIVTPISGFSAAAAQVSQASASAERIGTLCELPGETAICSVLPMSAMELNARDLCFSYGGAAAKSGQKNLISNVNMSFVKGEVTGMTGKNGSGKSTLLRLLIGLYAPLSGRVELKTDSGILTGEQIMPQTAYVPPDSWLFSGTIAENIIMADRTIRRDDMLSAASETNITELIQSLPNGLIRRWEKAAGLFRAARHSGLT